jgi:hypothetical protein
VHGAIELIWVFSCCTLLLLLLFTSNSSCRFAQPALRTQVTEILCHDCTACVLCVSQDCLNPTAGFECTGTAQRHGNMIASGVGCRLSIATILQ